MECFIVKRFEARLLKDNDYVCRIASPEKVICDKLYTLSPVSNKSELKKLLHDDLRIDEFEFEKLDMKRAVNQDT